MHWEQLIDEQALAKLLPPEYSHFARPVKEALCIFLSGLSQQRQAKVFGRQLTLSPSATVSERLGVLAHSCPVLQKLGQTLARDPRLDIELRHELQKLETLPPTVDVATISQSIAEELGPLESRGIRLEPPAIAEASVAVVIPFSQVRNSVSEKLVHGVFKLLKPGIEAELDEELGLLEVVGVHLDEQCEALGIPHLDYQDSFQQVQQKLSSELDLEHEQQLLREARTFYSQEPGVLIPEVYEFCSPRVTSMQRVYGSKITDCQNTSQKELNRLKSLLTRALISRPLLSSDERALFHGDPHAGNLFRTTDGRLAILDWSLAGSLPEPERVAINQVLLGAITMRQEKICSALESIAQRKQVDSFALQLVVSNWLKKFRRGELPGFRWLVGLLDDATHSARLRVDADLMLFRKSLLTIDGVLDGLGATAGHNDAVLILDFLCQLGVEWPRRWIVPPTSRRFGTRLSNIDLTETLLHLPWTAARCWRDELYDALSCLGRGVVDNSKT